MKKGAPPYSSISGLELWLALRERIFRTIDLVGLVIFVLILNFLNVLKATLFKKWTRWVVMGRRIDSAGVLLLSFRYLRCRKIFKADHVLPFDGTSRFLKQSIFYHLSSRWTSFPMLTRASLGEKYGIKPDVKNKKRIVTSAEQVLQYRSLMESVCSRTLQKNVYTWLWL